MGTDGFIEKRKYFKFNLVTKINFKIQEKEQKGVFLKASSGITKNLSLEGLCFQTDHKLDSGDILKIEILIPLKTESLHLEGRVQWVKCVNNQKGSEVFETGVHLFTVEKSDETRFMGYICSKMI